MKKLLSLLLVLLLIVGCTSDPAPADDTTDPDTTETDPTPDADETDEEEKTLTVYAFKGGFGDQHWKDMAAGFEALKGNVTVDLVIEANIDELLTPLISAGEYPDVIYYNQGQESQFTEGLVKSNQVADLEDLLTMTVPGEDVTVGEKIADGFTTNPTASPYGDGKLYLAPIFTSGPGFVYNANLVGDGKEYAYPTTWDDFFALQEQVETDGRHLFTWPQPGYLDATFPVMVANAGGEELLARVLGHEAGIYEDPEVVKVMETLGHLAQVTMPETAGNATRDGGFLDNQHAVMQDKALFMPNGDWVVGEMADYEAAEGFEWGLGPVPTFDADAKPYVVSWFESVYTLKDSPEQELAKEFIAYMYSDEAQEMIAKSGAYQPTTNAAEFMSEEAKALKEGVSGDVVSVSGTGFAATEPIPGLDWKAVFFGALNEVATGQKSVEDWIAEVSEANDRLSEVVITQE